MLCQNDTVPNDRPVLAGLSFCQNKTKLANKIIQLYGRRMCSTLSNLNQNGDK